MNPIKASYSFIFYDSSVEGDKVIREKRVILFGDIKISLGKLKLLFIG